MDTDFFKTILDVVSSLASSGPVGIFGSLAVLLIAGVFAFIYREKIKNMLIKKAKEETEQNNQTVIVETAQQASQAETNIQTSLDSLLSKEQLEKRKKLESLPYERLLYYAKLAYGEARVVSALNATSTEKDNREAIYKLYGCGI